MKVIKFSALSFFLMSCQNIQDAQSGTKLIGGNQDASSEKFPSMLYIGYKDGSSCTGVKVAKGTILTAAHCIHFPGEGNILAKGANVSIAATIQKNDGDALIPSSKPPVAHADFVDWANTGKTADDNPTTVPDIGIIYVEETGAFANIPITPIDLTPIVAGEVLHVGGYGCESLTKERIGAFPKRRKHAEAKSLASSRYPLYVTFDTRENDGVALCPGDSGGPVFRIEGSKTSVVAINAFEDGDSSSSTRLSEVKNFLSKGLDLELEDKLQNSKPTDDSGTNGKFQCAYKALISTKNAPIYVYSDRGGTSVVGTLPRCTEVCVPNDELDYYSGKNFNFKQIVLNNQTQYVSRYDLHEKSKCFK